MMLKKLFITEKLREKLKNAVLFNKDSVTKNFLFSLSRNSLSRRLLAAIILCSTVLALLATSTQLFIDYKNDLSDIELRMLDIERSNMESIASAAWNFDTQQIRTQLKGISHLPDIYFVELKDPEGKSVEKAGSIPARFKTITREMPVVFYKDASKKEKTVLGSLVVVASVEGVVQRLLSKAVIIMLTQMIKTFAVSVFILYVFHTMISRHLIAFSNYARKLDVHNLGEKFTLARRPPKGDPDEIDVLVSAFNDMTASIKRDVQELRDTKQALLEARGRYRRLVESTSVVPWEADLSMRHFTFVGPQAASLLGIPVESWHRENFWYEVLNSEDRERVEGILANQTLNQFEFECRIQHQDASEKWVSVQVEKQVDKKNKWVLHGFILNITERKHNELELQRYRTSLEMLVESRTQELAQKVDELGTVVRRLNAEVLERQRVEQSLRDNEERYRQLVEMSPDAIMIEKEERIIFANSSTLKLLAADHIDFVLDKKASDFIPNVFLQSKFGVSEEVGNEERSARPYETKVIRLDGEEVDVEISKAVFQSTDGSATQIVIHDISKHKIYEEQLRKQAHYDMLTGIPNRTLLIDRLQRAITRAERSQSTVIVLFIDLDRFKFVNDSLGHDTGDELLKTISHRMSTCIRKCDTLARLGGDEFIILMEDEPDEKFLSNLIQRLMTVISQPVLLKEQEITVTASIGCSMFPQDGVDAGTLLRHADTAMYRAKDTGRNNAQRYSSDMNVRVNEQLVIESRLRRAVEREEFMLHYQPQVDLRTGQIIGVEALIRWQHPELGLVSPVRFIPVAEDTGLIVPIGEWVLRTACAQAKAWQRDGLHPVRVAVNLSAQQLVRPDFEKEVEQVLLESELAPEWLELELTESMSMKNPEQTIQILGRLRNKGVNIAIDDFGTGYSNLAYLKRFPANRLKLDRSFVRDVMNDPDDAAIASAIIGMSHSLRLPVVAEGIETQDQLALLLSYGCDEMQGYYFSPPLTQQDCTKILRERKCLNLDVADKLAQVSA